MNTFNLEHAIAEWKKTLRGSPAFEDGQVAELEACLRDECQELVRQGTDPEEAFRKSVRAMGSAAEAGVEFYKAKRSRRSARPPWQPPRFVPALAWSYGLIALRKVRRQRTYSFINIAGLALGLACSTLMMLWVRDELSFDRFHANRDSLYRLITETKTENAVSLDARTPTPIGPALKSDLPEVADYCRYQGIEGYGIWSGDKLIYGDMVGIADPSFFGMFSFPLLKGDPKTALAGPRSIVVTESLARKYFGGDDPMGKVLLMTTMRDAYTVTGVIRDVPRHSHLHFDCMIPAVNMSRYHHVNFDNWKSMFFYVYVRLAPDASPPDVAAKMSALLRARAAAPGASLVLQPLKEVHLRSDFAFDLDNYAQGNASTLSLFSIAAAVILLLACINFMNLATARSANRAKEVGLRKVSGARRSDIVRQFLGESVVLSFLGLVLALLLLWMALPLFNGLAGKQLVFVRLFDPGLLGAVLGVTLLAGLLAGSYPALYLAGFEPARVLKGTFLGGERGQAVLRRGLVVLQFALTVFFIIGTIVVDKQLRFARTMDLGIDTHHVLTIEAPRRGMKEAMLANPSVLSTSGAIPPGEEIREITTVSWEGKDRETVIPFMPVEVDEDYLDTFRLRMAEGRFFSKDIASDRADSVVVNETAARAMGPGSPVGKRLSYSALNNQGGVEERTLTVIGVMKDFHQTSLRQAVEPMLFKNEGYHLLNLRISSSNIGETLAFVEKTWRSFMGDFQFSYNFLDDKIDGFYGSERKVRAILSLFTILALFTACMGLSGLAAFIAEKKTKEIGIRKVLGASARGLVLIQSREFLAWVLLANVLAWPAVYFAAGRWLQGFAYRVQPGITPALVAAVFSLTIAFLSVAYKAIQAARANPVDSLRYE